MLEPIRVVVTGAAGQIAYSLIYQLAKGDVFGENQPLYLHLLDIPPMMEVLEGVVMEIFDCALPLVKGIVPTTDLSVAFKDVDAAFMVGSMPRKKGMERKDLLSANVKIFKDQGQALDKYAKKSVKVLVVGNPANTNALMCAKFAPSIPKENFSAMTRLDQNRAQAALATKLGVPVDQVKNVYIWGNHSSTQFPDAFHASVNGKPVPELLKDDAWLKGDFVTKVQTRGAAVIAARKMSSAMSAAKAAGDHMRDLWHGTKPGTNVSMAVLSDGSYGIRPGLMFSFPITVQNKQWKIVQGLALDDFSRSKLDVTAKELMEEEEEAKSLCED
ncbi:malate dehydrogenase, cytoplasmic [Cimex lectularius]|uniref:Malate dehydrogenase n=1 Tax=Cimex lectularius TaxID=79782 RepID=A0A8I6RSG1_CIMLE|nr:malate dehydrogenase, cytoplasmic [Cimex lectularius]